MRISDGAIGSLGPDPEETLKPFEVFERKLTSFAAIMAARTGLEYEMDKVELFKAHTIWLNHCEGWLTSGCMPTGTKELSHFKVFGLLLHALTECSFVRFREGSNQSALAEIYGDLRQGDASQTQLFLDGQHYYLGWMFCHSIIEGYESDRTDRRTDYYPRITEDFELDMVSLLISGSHTPDSLYIIMKALFFRE